MKKKMGKYIKLIIVNLITIIRLIGAFILPFVYYKQGISASAVFIIILFLTDAIDGLFARTFKVCTFFGSGMDAISDKLLNTISFIILGIEYNVMIAPLSIEIAILYTSYSTYRYGGNIKASIIGKIKTIILDFFVILSFVLLALPTLKNKTYFILKLINLTDLTIHIFAFIILIACLITLFDYLGKNKIARMNPKANEIKNEQKTRKPFKKIIKTIFDTDYYQKHKNESILKQFYINN